MGGHVYYVPIVTNTPTPTLPGMRRLYFTRHSLKKLPVVSAKMKMKGGGEALISSCA